MCGLAGALVYDPAVARLDCLMAAVESSASRGTDSFGVVRWSPSRGFRQHRWLVSGRQDWLERVGVPEAGEPTVFLHTSRAEPTTEWQRQKTDADIPPFVESGIAVAHNGIIANDHEVAAAYGIRPVSAIDTAVIPSLVARLGVRRALASLKGGAALAILDSTTARLALCRNFMPLVLAWQPGVVSFASEAGFFPGIGEPLRSFQLWELPPFTGIELSAEGFSSPFAWGDVSEPSNAPWRPYPPLSWSDR